MALACDGYIDPEPQAPACGPLYQRGDPVIAKHQWGMDCHRDASGRSSVPHAAQEAKDGAPLALPHRRSRDPRSGSRSHASDDVFEQRRRGAASTWVYRRTATPPAALRSNFLKDGHLREIQNPHHCRRNLCSPSAAVHGARCVMVREGNRRSEDGANPVR